MSDFATPYFHLCLQKQRRESEGSAFALHQADQRPQTVISGRRFAELIERFGGEDRGDAVDMSSPVSGLPVRAGQ